MIAPIRPPLSETTSQRQRAMRRARRVVAETLLERTRPDDSAPRMANWQAWSMVVWMTGVASVYVSRMLGWW